jgi:hypothetical protein
MPKQTIPTAESGQDKRRMWRVSEDDLEAYLERAYKETQERIAAGTIKAETSDGDD